MTSSTLAYALEAHAGSVGLYADPQRRRFLMMVRRDLPEGEVVESINAPAGYLVTWALSEMIASEQGGADAATVARYQGRIAQVQRRAA